MMNRLFYGPERLVSLGVRLGTADRHPPRLIDGVPLRPIGIPPTHTYLWFWESGSRCGLGCKGEADEVLVTAVCGQNGPAEIGLHHWEEILNLQENADFGSTVHYEISPQLCSAQARQNNSITHVLRRFSLCVSRGEKCDGVLDYVEFTRLGVTRPDS